MLDFEFFVLAKARQALRIERRADFARPFAAVERRDGAIEIAVAHQLDQHIGFVIVGGHGDVEVPNPRADVGHDFRELGLAVGPGAVGKHAHRRVVFPDAVDAAGEMVLGAESGFQETLDDLAVGEDLRLGALALGDGGNFGGCGRRHKHLAERDGSQSGCQHSRKDRPVICVHCDHAAAIGTCTQGVIRPLPVHQRRVPSIRQPWSFCSDCIRTEAPISCLTRFLSQISLRNLRKLDCYANRSPPRIKSGAGFARKRSNS